MGRHNARGPCAGATAKRGSGPVGGEWQEGTAGEKTLLYPHQPFVRESETARDTIREAGLGSWKG